MLRRIAGFFFASGVAQIVGIAAGIAQAHALGPAGKSVVAYAAVGLALVLTATEGLSAAILTQYARDGRSAAVVRAALRRLVLTIVVPAALLLGAVAVAIPSQRPLLGAALAVPFAVFFQGGRGLLLASGRARDVIGIDFMNGALFGLVLIPLLLFAHIGPYAALALWIASWAGAGMLAYARARRIGPADDAPTSLEVRAAYGEQLRRGSKNSLTMLSGYVNLRIDVFLVSAVLGPRELGIYTLAITTSELLWSVSQPVVWANLDRVAGRPLEEAVALVVRITRNIFAVQLLLAACVAAAAPPLIALVYGTRFAESGLVLQLLLPGIALFAARALMGYFVLVRLDRPLLLTAIQSASAALCAAISLAAFPRFGIAGAALATSVTYTLVVIAIAVIFCRGTGVAPWALVIPTADDVAWYRRTFAAFVRARIPTRT